MPTTGGKAGPRRRAGRPPGSGDGRRNANPRGLPDLVVPALLAVAAALAFSSLPGDSITYDETSHLTAGMSYLKTGDFRLAPDHPPLPKLWAAWPLLFVQHAWPPPDTHGWQSADVFLTGRAWLFELNDGEQLLPIARGMMVVLLLALCVSIYALGRALFGPAAGRLALALAALSPTLLAHGRLVTTDVPITLCVTLTLLAFARLLRRVTAGRLLAAAGALAAASVSKLSWPLVLPALALMAAAAVLRREPIEVPASRARATAGEPPVSTGVEGTRLPQQAQWRPLSRRRDRAAAVGLIAVFLAITTLVCIWTCYGWRVSMFAEPTTEELAAGTADAPSDQPVQKVAAAWHRALYDADGQPRPGLSRAFVRSAAKWHLLPDAYLFGLAWTLEATSGRDAYFWGQTSTAGWRWYFPVAFAIKTPVATMILLLAGIAALLSRRCRPCGDPVLLAGVLAFFVTHVAYVIGSSFNIGQRHLLPIYPAVFALAGASAAWLQARIGRGLIAAALVWLLGANLWIHPHYLSYFNELIGGPANGHRYLADSNIDWGQDLKRLARYAQQHPEETIKLSYFGSAVPTRYGFECKLLPSSIETGSPEHLDGGGLYVISVTHLLGVYDTRAQDAYWRQPRVQGEYRRLDGERHLAPEKYARMRWGRFLVNLRRRPPDERIGHSLFVYRLRQADIDELTRP